MSGEPGEGERRVASAAAERPSAANGTKSTSASCTSAPVSRTAISRDIPEKTG